jgi:hypothetical protein
MTNGTDIICDWPTGEKTTCDKAMCERHRRRVGKADYCRDHEGEP